MEISDRSDKIQKKNKSGTMDMTTGNIVKLLLLFTVPLVLGNLFQMLYNTVDVLVVGNFVGKEALAAVGSTTPIVNIVVFFFHGVSIGAGVVISHYFGAKDMENLHKSVETTMAITFFFGVLFTIAGVGLVPFMLRMMATPEDVMGPATLYLRIYFAGILGLLIYNMGSGILRAVGDTKRPLIFLMCTSVLNIILDVLFVVVFHRGIDGVAYATIISQFVSALMVMTLLCRTHEIYRFSFGDMKPDWPIVSQIMSVGLPAGVQSMITSFSNVFVQAYVNSFGSSVMAGWSCYTKMDQFMFLPIQSMSQAGTTFVSQNIGAKNFKRANEGAVKAVLMGVTVSITFATIIWIFAGTVTRCFTGDESVIYYGKLFLRMNVYFMVFNGVNHMVAGTLRGRGDAKGPMIIMLSCFVVVRQIYLFTVNHLCRNVYTIGLGYPVGWVTCMITMVIYNNMVMKKYASADQTAES